MSGRVWAFVHEFVRAFFAEARRVLTGAQDIEIIEQQDTRLVWHTGGRETVADQRLRAVMSNGRVLARFDAIESIDIRRTQRGDAPEMWDVSLHLAARSRVRVARSTDATDASILAAHLSTITGKKVQAAR
jgi:hypothetical protein